MYLQLCATLVLIYLTLSNGYTLSESATTEIWDENDAFGYTGPPSPDLRLPSDVVPSFYRLKIKADLENSVFKGDVYITVKAMKNVREIILHSKGLSINNDAKLTEQMYEQIETLHKTKRQAPELNSTAEATNATVPAAEGAASNETATVAPESTVTTQAPISEATNTSISKNETSTSAPQPAQNDQPANSTEPSTEAPMLKNTEYTVSSGETQVTHSAVRNVKILSITQGTGDQLIITLASALKPNKDYILELSFAGNISDTMMGFYKSSYVTSDQQVRKLGVTQFEPTSARAAFPCFDEPAFKAMFEISIAHQANLTALSNMKVSSSEDIPDSPGWKWTHFDRSVNMSTYLVAYVISDFTYVETNYTSRDNITKPIRVWTRPELINKANYALTVTPMLLSYYEEVFGVPYALDKLDLIAVPDFSSGAMENWGLITFRETTLLFDEKNSVPRDKQTVAFDIAHELAHQWFGNLVTMRWWTDLWLNEGFATYIEYVGVDHIEPQFKIFETFSMDKMDLLRPDSLKNTSPVSRKVVDATEISQKFDVISYNKGAVLIRMLNNTVTEKLFHKGLQIYLNEWKYANAEENDLWEAMSKAVLSDPSLGGLSVVEFMNSWTKQAGYPVVNVKRNYESGDVIFEQKLFTSAKDPYEEMVSQLWHIPVSYTGVGSAPAVGAVPKLWLKDRSTIANLPYNSSQAIYVNVDAIGYYRVNYDEKNWELLSAALKTGYFSSPITKAQLIDDAFNLAKSSQLNYSQALGLTTCVMDGEDSKIVWDLLLNNMGFLKHNIRKTSGYMYFQDYMKMILQKQLERMNYGLNPPKDDNEAFLIENLVMWECEVESPRCLDWARKQFEEWAARPDNTNNTIPSYFRSLVYNMALRHGGRREFELLWDAFQNATDPNVKSLIISNLPSTREAALITLLLERSINNELPNQYASDVWSVEPTVGTRIAQDFLVNNFHAIYDKFINMDEFLFQNIVNSVFGFITTQDELDKFKSFVHQYKEKLKPISQSLRKILDTASLRIEWVSKHASTVNAWFKRYVTDHQNGAHSQSPGNSTNTNQSQSARQTENVTQTPVGNVTQNGNASGNAGAARTGNQTEAATQSTTAAPVATNTTV